MAHDMKELDQLYADIRDNEVCYYQGNAIHRRHENGRGFMYSVNDTRLFDLFSEAVDYIDSQENSNIRS